MSGKLVVGNIPNSEYLVFNFMQKLKQLGKGNQTLTNKCTVALIDDVLQDFNNDDGHKDEH